MSDAAVTTPQEDLLAMLRQREAELDLQATHVAERLSEVRGLIGGFASRRPRAARKLRTPEQRIAAGLAEPAPSAPVESTHPNATLATALASLGRVVAERDAEHAAELEPV